MRVAEMTNETLLTDRFAHGQKPPRVDAHKLVLIPAQTLYARSCTNRHANKAYSLNTRSKPSHTRRPIDIVKAAPDVGLAWRLENGIGLDKNEKLAFECYLKAAHQDNIDAQLNVSECLLKGVGCTADKHAAIHWLKRAGACGSVFAARRLRELDIDVLKP